MSTHEMSAVQIASVNPSACRFANAERLFREEAKLTGEPGLGGVSESSVFEDLLLFNVADGNAKRFLEEFDSLAAWIDQSLDVYKVRGRLPTLLASSASRSQTWWVADHDDAGDVHVQGELSKVLYPVFMHCYLGLVKRNATVEAHQLMTRHKARFTTAAGSANQQHMQVP